MTQQGLCHTSSVRMLRSWRRVMGGRSPQDRAAGATPESHRRPPQVNGLPALSSALGEAPQVLARAAVLHRAAGDRAGAPGGVGRAPAAARRRRHGLRLALGEDLHPTVGQVAGEPDQAELERPGADPPAEPDTLDPALDEDRARAPWTLILRTRPRAGSRTGPARPAPRATRRRLLESGPVTDSDLTTRPVRWGILGAGGIASSLAADISRTDGHVVAAVAARDADRAAEFARRYDAPRSFGSYDELCADDEVDVVYVATTHPFHREQALAAIEAGKPVLVEKPLTLDAGGAREVFAAAAQGRGLRDGGDVDAHQPAGPAGAGPGRRRGAGRGARRPGRLRLRPRLRPGAPAAGPRQRRRRPARPRHLPRDVRVAVPGRPRPGPGQRRPGADRRRPDGRDAVVPRGRGHRPAVQLLGRHDVVPGHRLRDTAAG